MKKNRTLLILVLSCLIILFAYSNRYREEKSFDEIVKESYAFEIDLMNHLSNFKDIDLNISLSENSHEKSVNTLYTESDLVVIASPLTRIQYGDLVETKVEIKKVLNGKTNLNSIYVFEKYFVYNQSKELNQENYIVTSFSGQQIMEDNKEYILFLTQEKGYKNGDRYSIVTDYYGMYPLIDQFNELLIYGESTNTLNIIDFKKFANISHYFYILRDDNILQLNEIINQQILEHTLRKGEVPEYFYNEEMKRLENLKLSISIVSSYQKTYVELYKNILKNENMKTPIFFEEIYN